MYRAVQSYLVKIKISTSATISSTSSTEPTSEEPALNSIMSSTTASSSSSRLPVYFLGIGGPNFMENTAHPAYANLATIGREITTQVKPKAIVVFSAHWQEGPSRIKINAAEHTDIIYDFYNFPPHYYEYKFPNKGSPALAQKIVDRLGAVGIEVEKVQRGLDHGVWAGFIIGMFIRQDCCL
jgi:4,5-DOPA dioxygenase extradiol